MKKLHEFIGKMSAELSWEVRKAILYSRQSEPKAPGIELDELMVT